MEQRRSEKFIKLVIYLYLVLPVMIFFAGWLKWQIALPVDLLILVCLGLSLRNDRITGKLPGKINWEKVILALLLIVVWVWLSGVGGLGFQNSDHRARNAIFRVLIDYDWPVVSKTSDSALIYYLGYWMPAALFGKLFGFTAGLAFEVFWTILGIGIFYYLIGLWRGKYELWPLFLVIFFSGLDTVGIMLRGEAPASLWTISHLENWSVTAQFSSMTTQLFWVFNQCIPAWIATLFIMVQKNGKNIWFILSCIIISATLPFVGLIPIALYFALRHMKLNKQSILETIKGFLTIQNLTGVFVIGIISVAYLLGGNQSTVAVKQIPFAHWNYIFVHYGTFWFVEAGIFLVFLWNHYKHNVLYYICGAWLWICPFIKAGDKIDFCMRTSIPALVVIMVFCMESLSRYAREKKWTWLVPMICVICLGAVTPIHEIHRSVNKLIAANLEGGQYLAEEISIEDNLFQKVMYSGAVKDNIFFEKLARLNYDEYMAEKYPEEASEEKE
ncbi:MAG: hypothetical protein IIY55_11095 [Blautia sp.]|nr:hypothetical protein [Blautia sp.]